MVGLPSAFSAVTQPNMCGAMSLLQNGQAFISTVIQDAQTIQASIYNTVGTLMALPSQIEGIVLADVQALASQLTAIAASAINTLVSHLVGQFTNLINNLTIAIAQSGAQSGLASSGCGLPSAPPADANNPCGNMEALFGSIMGLGSALLGKVTDALGGSLARSAI
jgi:hypothetical protein